MPQWFQTSLPGIRIREPQESGCFLRRSASSLSALMHRHRAKKTTSMPVHEGGLPGSPMATMRSGKQASKQASTTGDAWQTAKRGQRVVSAMLTEEYRLFAEHWIIEVRSAKWRAGCAGSSDAHAMRAGCAGGADVRMVRACTLCEPDALAARTLSCSGRIPKIPTKGRNTDEADALSMSPT